MAEGLNRMAKRELLASIQGRYPGSSRRDNKGRILGKFIATACHHRKHGIRLLRVDSGRGQNSTSRLLLAFSPPVFAGEHNVGLSRGRDVGQQIGVDGEPRAFPLSDTFAEFGADLSRMRTRESMAVARTKGKLGDKQPKLTDRQQRELCRMHATGEYSISKITEILSVSRPTVYRISQPQLLPLAYDPAPYWNPLQLVPLEPYFHQ